MNNKDKNPEFNVQAFKGSVLDKIFVRPLLDALLNALSRMGDALYYPDGRIVKDAK
jgi:hypothetical protein